MKNTEVSKELGKNWSVATDEEKLPFVEKEKQDRLRYKKEMEQWNANAAEREFAERQSQYHHHGMTSSFDHPMPVYTNHTYEA